MYGCEHEDDVRNKSLAVTKCSMVWMYHSHLLGLAQTEWYIGSAVGRKH